MTYRMGSSRVSLVNGRRIGLLVLGVIVLTWLPILGPPRRDVDQAGPGGRGRSHPRVRVRPRWRDDRHDPDGWPRGAAGRGRWW